MPDAPYLIKADTLEEAMSQFQRYITDLYEERIGGAELGDVFEIGADDILSLAVASGGGLYKASSALAIKIKSTGGLVTTTDGAGIKLNGGSLALDADGLSVTDGYDGFSSASELTLNVSGSISMPLSKPFRYHTVDTYSDASTDDLETITGGNEGELALLGLENASRVVTIKDSAGIKTGGGDLVLQNTTERALLVCISSSVWYAIGIFKNPVFDGVQVASEEVYGNHTLSIDDTVILSNGSVGEYSTVASPTNYTDDGHISHDGNGFQNNNANMSLGTRYGDIYDLFIRFDSFAGDNLPQGTIITDATISLDSSDVTDPVLIVDAYCEDVDAAVAPTNYAQFTGLSLTGAVAQTLALNVHEIDLTAAAQEIVDRVGYSADNAIMAVVKNNGSADKRSYKSYEADGYDDPALTITFNTSVPTIEIPSAIITSYPGRPFVVAKIDSSEHRTDITCEGSETINGSATVSLNNQYDGVILISDGTNVNAFFFHERITNAMVTYLESLVADITQTNLVDKSASETITGDWTFTGGMKGKGRAKLFYYGNF